MTTFTKLNILLVVVRMGAVMLGNKSSHLPNLSGSWLQYFPFLFMLFAGSRSTANSAPCLLTPGLSLAKQTEVRELWGGLHQQWNVLAQKRCMASTHNHWPEVAMQHPSSLVGPWKCLFSWHHQSPTSTSSKSTLGETLSQRNNYWNIGVISRCFLNSWISRKIDKIYGITCSLVT